MLAGFALWSKGRAGPVSCGHQRDVVSLSARLRLAKGPLRRRRYAGAVRGVVHNFAGAQPNFAMYSCVGSSAEPLFRHLQRSETISARRSIEDTRSLLGVR